MVKYKQRRLRRCFLEVYEISDLRKPQTKYHTYSKRIQYQNFHGSNWSTEEDSNYRVNRSCPVSASKYSRNKNIGIQRSEKKPAVLVQNPRCFYERIGLTMLTADAHHYAAREAEH